MTSGQHGSTFRMLSSGKLLHAERAARTAEDFGQAVLLHAKRAARTTVDFWHAACTQSEQLEPLTTSGRLVCTQREQLELPVSSIQLLARRASSSIYWGLLASTDLHSGC